MVQCPDTAPRWLSESITYLSPKTKDTKNLENYRPITCLTTTYKLLTFINLFMKKLTPLWKIVMHSHWTRSSVKEVCMSVKTSHYKQNATRTLEI